MIKKTLILIAVFIGILFCAVGFADSQFRTAVGQKAPALILPERAGYAPRTSLSDNLGKYVMLNFWKATDAPSRKAANEYTAWLRNHKGNKFRLLSVNIDETPQLFDEIVRRDSLIRTTQYHVSGDTARAIVDTYGLDKGLGSLLIDPNGKIISHNPTVKDLDDIFGR